MRCPACQVEQVVSPKVPLCVHCGARLPVTLAHAKRCPACRFPAPERARSCPECGADLEAVAPSPVPAPPVATPVVRSRRTPLLLAAGLATLLLVVLLAWLLLPRPAAPTAAQIAPSIPRAAPAAGGLELSPARLQQFLEVRRRLVERGYRPNAELLRSLATRSQPTGSEVEALFQVIKAIRWEHGRALAEVGMSATEYRNLARRITELLVLNDLPAVERAEVTASELRRLGGRLSELAAAEPDPDRRAALEALGRETEQQLEELSGLAQTAVGSSHAAGLALLKPHWPELRGYEILRLDELIFSGP